MADVTNWPTAWEQAGDPEPAGDPEQAVPEQAVPELGDAEHGDAEHGDAEHGDAASAAPEGAAEQTTLVAAERRAVQRRRARSERKGDRPVRVRGRKPVIPVGDPEDLDDVRHPRATLIGLVAVGVLFLLSSLAIGTSLRDGERTTTVQRVAVPRVDGSTLDDASRAIGDLGLLVAVEYQPNEGVPEGVVFAQRPVAGSKLEIGTEVTLVVSDGPAGLKVPEVEGLQGGEAAKQLQANGFAPVIVPTHDEVVRPGEVLRTEPAAGTRAPPGATIDVLVSAGPAPHVVPDITGQEVAQGFSALGRAGVGLGAVSTVAADGRPAGVVVSTDPPGGTSVPRDQPVAVVVTESTPVTSVPSVTGLLQATATKALASSGLVVSIRTQSVPFDDSRGGRVIAQSIPAGTPYVSGVPIQLTVAVAAAPPTTTTVPQDSTTTVP